MREHSLRQVLLLLLLSISGRLLAKKISVTAIEGGILSYSLKDIVENYNGDPNSYTVYNQQYAYLNSVHEVEFGNYDTSKIGRAVYSWWEYVTD